jgi:hypothetical protein
MKLKDWCAANDISKYQYHYWWKKTRLEYYEMAVKKLQECEAGKNITVPVQVQRGSFVEIRPEIMREPPNHASQPMGVVQKGSIRVEILESATASFISRLLEAVHYA